MDVKTKINKKVYSRQKIYMVLDYHTMELQNVRISFLVRPGICSIMVAYHSKSPVVDSPPSSQHTSTNLSPSYAYLAAIVTFSFVNLRMDRFSIGVLERKRSEIRLNEETICGLWLGHNPLF